MTQALVNFQRRRDPPALIGAAVRHAFDPLQRWQIRSPNPSLQKEALQRKQNRSFGVSPSARFGLSIVISSFFICLACSSTNRILVQYLTEFMEIAVRGCVGLASLHSQPPELLKLRGADLATSCVRFSVHAF